ncbi:hypothetical protein GW7_11609 [Heterocephalus glaber]|uniref:Fibrous sheath-interacting protein 2 C-terminal domain-containing protein n=1 Tax=Heterocephalus glaber TaxID=10181 RepID=G5BRY4_HETGA|nr:hypothetical protein GW7_11609 [Heterocephalus glaber]
MAGIVTTLVKSIILEFTTSEILVADSLEKKIFFSEEYKEMVQETVDLIYEKLLDEYKSLVHVNRAIQSDTTCVGRKIYHFLLEEIYDYQVKSLVSGELGSSSCSSLRADNIIRNVLSGILSDGSTLPSCITVLPSSLLEDMIYKLLVRIFPPADTENKPTEEELTPDDDSAAAASAMTDEIIKEIFEHEIQLATTEENAESMQLEVLENLVDSICNNILTKPEFQAEVQKDASAEPEDYSSNLEEMDMISQVVDSVYGNMLQQSRSHEELYDLKDTNTVFPKVASLIVDGVSKVPLDRATSTSSYMGIFGDVAVDRITKKTEKHAEKMIDGKSKLKEDKSGEEYSVVIIPHVGRKAIKINPHIISQHLVVISVKTQPLEKMKTECLKRTGHSVEELRQASVNGRSYAAVSSPDLENRKRERDVPLWILQVDSI